MLTSYHDASWFSKGRMNSPLFINSVFCVAKHGSLYFKWSLNSFTGGIQYTIWFYFINTRCSSHLTNEPSLGIYDILIEPLFTNHHGRATLQSRFHNKWVLIWETRKRARTPPVQCPSLPPIQFDRERVRENVRRLRRLLELTRHQSVCT